jgi:hypothetical protein
VGVFDREENARYAAVGDVSRPADKLKLWVGQPVNAPFVTPPIGLRAILIVCVLSVIATLIQGVARQLSLGGTPADSAFDLAVIAGFYFALPIVVSVTIVTNWPLNRPLSIVFFGFLALKASQFADTLSYSPETRTYIAVAIGLLWLWQIWWMYRSARMRVYYCLVSGGSIPADLRERIEELTSPGRFEELFGRFSRWIGNYTEIAAATLILAFVFIAWASMTI